jgi:hypothetical protein
MKLSNETLNVLKNFSTINENLEFKQGKRIRTISPSKTVLAEAGIPDDIPETFCVYDLNQFLSVNSLFKDKAELSFDNTCIIFKNGRNKIKYRKCAETNIVRPPDKNLVLTDAEVAFTLSAEDYHWILDTAKVLSSPHIAIQSDDEGKVEISTFDAVNDAQHVNSIEIETKKITSKYKIVFTTENFKMIPGSYDVEISFKGLAHFKNTKDDIQYWIASEIKHNKIG